MIENTINEEEDYSIGSQMEKYSDEIEVCAENLTGKREREKTEEAIRKEFVKMNYTIMNGVLATSFMNERISSEYTQEIGSIVRQCCEGCVTQLVDFQYKNVNDISQKMQEYLHDCMLEVENEVSQNNKNPLDNVRKRSNE